MADQITLTGAVQTAPPEKKRRYRRGFAPAVPVLAFLLLCFALPVLALLLRSILEPHFGLQNYAALLATSTYANVLENTFLISFMVTAITTLVGLPLAWFITVAPRWLGRLVFGVVILSMWTNLLARTYAWMVLLQDNGPINNFLIWTGIIQTPLPLYGSMAGVVIGMVYIMLPFMVISLRGPLASLDPSMFQAASLCGASRLQSFTRVFLPLLLPGLAAGGLIIFVMSLGYYITPSLLGGAQDMMLAELIAQQVQTLLNWGLAGAASFVLLVVTLALYAVQARYLAPHSQKRS
jgi:putative spermidine/putrescine transport system permease protein